MSDVRRIFTETVLGRPVRVTLLDGRIIYGQLTCIDDRRNVVLSAAAEQLEGKYIAPVNDVLNFHTKQLLKVYNYVDGSLLTNLNTDQRAQLEQEFAKDKFYVGQVIIPGRLLAKLELQERKPDA